MTPRGATAQHVRRLATWLPRLADPASVERAAEAIWEIGCAAPRHDDPHPPDQRPTREGEDARQLEPYAAAIDLLAVDGDALTPAWVGRFLELERASHQRQERLSAAIRSGAEELPDFDLTASLAGNELLRVLQALGPRLDPHAAPIIGALGTMDRERDERLAAALEHAGPVVVAAVPKLMASLRDHGIWCWPSHLARALANASRHDRGVVPALRALLGSDSAETRRSAMDVLGQIGPAARSAAPELLAFRDGDESERCNMIHALARQGSPSADFLEVLDEAMGDPSGYVRRSAVHALGELAPEPARFVPRLIEACDWTEPLHDEGLAEAAVEALARYGPAARDAVPRLLRFVEGPVEVRTVDPDLIGHAVARITGGEVTPASSVTPRLRTSGPADDEPLFPVSHAGRHCYVDRSGRIVIQTPYFHGTRFSDGHSIVHDDEGGTFVIDRRGQVVFRSTWDAIRLYSEGLAAVEKGEKWGFVDHDGRVVVEPQFDSVTAFSEGLAGFELGRARAEVDGGGISLRQPGRQGFIDRLGSVVIPAEWTEAYRFRDGRAAVCTGGMVRPSLVWEGVETLQERRYGFIDRMGRLVIPGEYHLPGSFSQGLAAVMTEHRGGRIRFGYIDTAGRAVTPMAFTWAHDFSDGVAVVRRRGRRRRGSSFLIDSAGRVVAELAFPRVESFSEGLAAAYTVGGGCGFIDARGEWVIRPQFDQCGPFRDGLAEVQRGRWYGLIDRAGAFVWGPTTEGALDVVLEGDWT